MEGNIQVDGIPDLVKKMAALGKKVTRAELLKIQRKIARPIILAYRGNLPKRSKALAKSVKNKTVSPKKSKGNPELTVQPTLYYRFMVVPTGTNLASNRRGSRKGVNTVVPEARKKAINETSAAAAQNAEALVAAFLKQKING